MGACVCGRGFGGGMGRFGGDCIDPPLPLAAEDREHREAREQTKSKPKPFHTSYVSVQTTRGDECRVRGVT